MEDTPEQKAHAGPVPQTADEEYKYYIDVGPQLSLPAAAQRNVNIPCQKTGQGFVPAIPEILDIQGFVGRVKVSRKIDIHHFSDAQSHIAVATEIQVDLQGVGQHGNQRPGAVQCVHSVEADVGHIAEKIRQQHLFAEPQGKR